MTYRVVLTGQAKADIANVATWYKDRAPEQAPRFRARLVETLGWLRSRPLVWPTRADGYRRVAITGFPYHIWYKVTDTTVTVILVVHMRRDPALSARRRSEFRDI
jgi:plasmid stabilization system protein ParE